MKIKLKLYEDLSMWQLKSFLIFLFSGSCWRSHAFSWTEAPKRRGER